MSSKSVSGLRFSWGTFAPGGGGAVLIRLPLFASSLYFPSQISSVMMVILPGSRGRFAPRFARRLKSASISLRLRNRSAINSLVAERLLGACASTRRFQSADRPATYRFTIASSRFRIVRARAVQAACSGVAFSSPQRALGLSWPAAKRACCFS